VIRDDYCRVTGNDSAQEESAVAVVAMAVVHPDLRWEVVAARHATQPPSRRMDIHENVCSTPRGRADLARRVLHQGQPQQVVAAAFRHHAEDGARMGRSLPGRGVNRLQDRSSRPHRLSWSGARSKGRVDGSPSAGGERRRGVAALDEQPQARGEPAVEPRRARLARSRSGGYSDRQTDQVFTMGGGRAVAHMDTTHGCQRAGLGSGGPTARSNASRPGRHLPSEAAVGRPADGSPHAHGCGWALGPTRSATLEAVGSKVGRCIPIGARRTGPGYPMMGMVRQLDREQHRRCEGRCGALQ
jgi:hypothetical protein